MQDEKKQTQSREKYFVWKKINPTYVRLGTVSTFILIFTLVHLLPAFLKVGSMDN